MAFRQQATGRIGHDPAAIGVVAVVDEPRRLALLAEAKALIGDQLVMCKTVVQFDHVEIIGPDAGSLIHLFGGIARHVEADHLHHVAGAEGRGGVRRHRLRADADVPA